MAESSHPAGLNNPLGAAVFSLCLDGQDVRPRSNCSLLPFQIDGLHRQIPVGFQDFETLLFLAFVGFFIGE